MITTQKSAIYHKHIYDIDLKELIINYEDGIRKVALSNTDHSAEELIIQLKKQIKNYCVFKEIVFEEQFQILVTKENELQFWKFLAYSLMFMNPYKIKLFLNYHRRKYTKFYNGTDKNGEAYK